MMKSICTAEVAIQGDRVLRLVNHTEERAIYEIIGFENPVITIIDFRRRGLKAISRLIKSGNLEDFAPEFNTPARLTIRYNESGISMIELNETQGEKPEHMLWIVVGLGDTLPVYDYCVESIAPLEDGSFAFVAVFTIPAISSETGSGRCFECEYAR